MPTRECVGAWTGGMRAQAGHLAPARSERSGEPFGLTGRARMTRWAGIRRTGPLWRLRRAVDRGGSDEPLSNSATPERDGEQNQEKDMRGASGVVGISFRRLLNKATHAAGGDRTVHRCGE